MPKLNILIIYEIKKEKLNDQETKTINNIPNIKERRLPELEPKKIPELEQEGKYSSSREYFLKAFVLILIFIIYTSTTLVSVFSGFMGDKAKLIRAGTKPISDNTLPIISMIVAYYYGKQENTQNKSE